MPTRHRSAPPSAATTDQDRTDGPTSETWANPMTCEREYTPAEAELMEAIGEYKRSSGRMFPTWSEVLEVIKSLGYEKSYG